MHSEADGIRTDCLQLTTQSPLNDLNILGPTMTIMTRESYKRGETPAMQGVAEFRKGKDLRFLSGKVDTLVYGSTNPLRMA